MDCRGKKVGIIGSGSTALQIVQELTKTADSLVTFIRTPNTALPMRQRKLQPEEVDHMKGLYDVILRQSARKTFGGFTYNPPPCASPQMLSPEERETFFEELYQRGAFNYSAGNFLSSLFDPTDNRMIYDFWAKKTRARIRDPVKRDILAPLEPLHPFLTKRPGIEADYYECCDSEHVRVVDLKKTPIEAFTKQGLKIGGDGGEGGEEIDLDIIVLATGFDNYTGAFSTMGIKGTDGVDLNDRWKEGVTTSLGLMVPEHPNMWMVYGPQGISPSPSIFTPVY